MRKLRLMFMKVENTKAGCRVWTLQHNAVQPFKLNLCPPKSQPHALIMYHISIHLSEWLKLKQKQNQELTMLSADKDVEQLELSYTLVDNAQWFSPLENNLAICLIKLTIQLPHEAEILCLGTRPRKINTHVHTKIHTWMLIAALFIWAPHLKQSKCFSIAEWKITVHPHEEILFCN